MNRDYNALGERFGSVLTTDHVLQSTVAALPAAGVESGAMAYVSDGRKLGETAGNGTGVIAYAESVGGEVTWRRFSDDAEVEA